MSCPIKYNWSECSSYESENTDCGNCIHTENMPNENLREFLSLQLQYVKYLSTAYNSLNNMIQEYIKEEKANRINLSDYMPKQ